MGKWVFFSFGVLFLFCSSQLFGQQISESDWNVDRLIRYQDSESFEEYNYVGAVATEPDHPLSFTLNTLYLPRLIDDHLRQTYATKMKFKLVAKSDRGRLQHPRLKDLIGEKVLSIGEGFDVFLPYLIEKGVQVRALDICYRRLVRGDWAKLYMELYGNPKTKKNYLIGADVKSLSTLIGKGNVFEPGSLAMVVTHNLFDYLDEDRQTKMILDSLKLLKPGGSFRANFVSGWLDIEGQVADLINQFNQGGADEDQIRYEWVYLEGSSSIEYKNPETIATTDIARGFSEDSLKRYNINLEPIFHDEGWEKPFHYPTQTILLITKRK
ncbi:MAG: hypothetical protein KDD52_07550 [Bdellovibrionales bacterium]|nr:hypothetical protein [Bdellovibrionales bacterium]